MKDDMVNGTSSGPRWRRFATRGPGVVLLGYGPLIALAVVFVLMAAAVPSVVEEASADRPEAREVNRPSVPGLDGQDDVDGSREGSQGGVTGETGTASDPQRRTERRVVGGGGGDGGPGPGPCAGRDRQVPADPYSPPCIEWDGDNGGSTWQGVGQDDIVLSYRVLDEPGFQQTLAQLAGAQITDRPPDIRRTISALAEFFNERYQFYGRQLRIEFYDGQGSSREELLGGGHAEAEQDAITADQQLGAFAELNGATEPFIDALARRDVIGFGSPYLSREWHIERAPYAWSIATDCSIISEVAAELAIKQLVDRPAVFAGGNLEGQERKLAGLSPENPWYQECHDAANRTLEQSGADPGKKINYRLHIDSMSNQAASVVSQLKSDEVTTVLCGCDPIFPVFLSAKAAEQNYQPEWVVLGTAFTDIDIVGQLYQQDQWSRAFGVSSLGSPIPQRAGLGYSAYKTVRDDEPAFAVEPMYAQMLMLSIGIQMAGPNLTPHTFEQGMFDYPGGHGRFGTWGFDERSYTPTRDYRVVWWDPDRLSEENSEKGAYVEAYGGQRFPVGGIPQLGPNEQPPVFGR